MANNLDPSKLLTKLVKSDIDRFLTLISSQREESVDAYLKSCQNDDLMYQIQILSTNQCSNLLQLLLKRLEESINSFEQEKLNVAEMQGVEWLLCAVLSNSRFVGSAASHAVAAAVNQAMLLMKHLLARFGAAILVRTHVRKVMQSFLRLCHVWGDVIVISHDVNTTTSDSDTSDLSHVFSFLSNQQWSVIIERIANFGDRICNRLLMQLQIQKLEHSLYISVDGQTHCEQISKNLVESLVSNGQQSVATVLTPEQFSFVLGNLSRTTAKSFVSLLYRQILDDNELLMYWADNTILLENQIFIECLFEVSLKALLDKYAGNVSTEHMELYNASKRISLEEPCDISLICDLINNSLGTSYNNSTVVGEISRAIVNLPLNRIGKSKNSLLLVAGTMVSLGIGDSLIHIFERLLEFADNLNSCFDAGLMITWISKHVSNPTLRSSSTQVLVKKSTTDFIGLQKFKEYVKSFKTSDEAQSVAVLETQVNLHVSIKRCWRENRKDKESLEYNAVLAKQRKMLCKQVRTVLKDVVQESNNPETDWVLFDAFTIDLQWRQREQPLSVHELIGLNFNLYLEKALSCLKENNDENARKSSLNFVTTVLRSAQLLRTATKNKDFVVDIYKKLEGSSCPDVVWETIVSSSTTYDMAEIMAIIVKKVMPSLTSGDVIDFTGEPAEEARLIFLEDYRQHEMSRPWCNHYIHVWRLFIEKATGDKLKCCCDPIKKLTAHPEYNLPVTDDFLNGSLLTWLRFLHFIAGHPQIYRTARIEKYLIHVILSTPSDLPHDLYFKLHVDITTVLVSHRQSPIVRYPHLVFQIFKKLLNWLVLQGDAKGSVQSAFILEKLVGLLVRRQELRLIFFLQEIISVFVTKEITNLVKMHLKNCAFSFLGAIDEKSSSSLQASLPQGCREVFKNIHTEFSKFYRYKGKI